MATTTNPLLPLAVREWTEAKRAAAESIVAARRPGVVDWRDGRSWTLRVMHHAQPSQQREHARHAHAETVERRQEAQQAVTLG